MKVVLQRVGAPDAAGFGARTAAGFGARTAAGFGAGLLRILTRMRNRGGN